MPDNDNLIGKQLDNYRIVAHLGRGGMADVYLAEDEALQRKAVIKTMLPHLAQDATLVARFQREAQATARLEHPNIVPVYTTGTTPDKRPYIAFQYIEGGSLEAYLETQAQAGQSISSVYALAIGQQMAQALTVAHAAGIVHRDLKPSNILLRRDGTPVLADLGIAAMADTTQRLTQTGNIIGTPYYMSPEQAQGKPLDGRSDIYSLGVILYELLSRQLPFAASSPISMLHAHIYEPPVPLEQVRPGLSPQTYAVVARCLQKDPNARFADAKELASGLAVALSAEGGSANIQSGTWDRTVTHPIGIGATVVEKPIPASPSRRWRGIVGAVLGVLVLIAALLAGLVVSQGMGTESEPTVQAVVATATVPSTATAPIPTLLPNDESTNEAGDSAEDTITAESAESESEIISICLATVTGTEGLGLFLRAQASSETTIRQVLDDGTHVNVSNEIVIEDDIIWRRITTANQVEGWVVEDFLQPIPPCVFSEP